MAEISTEAGENKHKEFFESKVLGHPAGLFVLFFTEMWERFSFYGMRVLLINFLTIAAIGSNPGWEWTSTNAGALFGTYAGLLYLTPIVGGFIADKFTGYRWAVVIGCIIMTAGHASMAVETEFSLYLGLALLVIGTGFFKPNITSIISEMYEYLPEKKDGAYTIFYMGVNSGAFFGMMLCGYLAERVGWAYGFGLAGIFMLFGTLQFLFAKPLFGDVGGIPKKIKAKKEAAAKTAENKPQEKSYKENKFTLVDKILIVITSIIGLLYLIDDPISKIGNVHLLPKEFIFPADQISGSLVVTIIGLILFLYLVFSRISRYEKVLRDRMIAVIIFAFFTVLFFIPFEQAATSMVLFARDYTHRVMTGNAALIFNIANTLLTVIPLIIISWVLILLNKRTFKKIPSSNVVLALCFTVMWGLAIWMLVQDFNTNSFNAKYATVPVEKVANERGDVIFESFPEEKFSSENKDLAFQEGDTIAVRLNKGDYKSLDKERVIVDYQKAPPQSKYAFGQVEDADSTQFKVQVDEIRKQNNRAIYKPIKELPKDHKSFVSTPVIGKTTNENLALGEEVAIANGVEVDSAAQEQNDMVTIDYDEADDSKVEEFAYGRISKNDNGTLSVEIDTLVQGRNLVVYEPISEARPIKEDDHTVTKTLSFSSKEDLTIGDSVATHIELGKFELLNNDKAHKLKADYAEAGLPSKIIQAEVSEVKESEVTITTSWFSILNSFFIIAFASAFSKWWDSKYNPSAAVKYGLGLIVMAIGFAVLAYGSRIIPAGTPPGAIRVGMIWLILAYLFHTLGELCLSPVGLSYVSKLVPARMIALMFGVWYLAIAIGNKVAASMGGMIETFQDEQSLSSFFMIFAIAPFAAGVVVIILNPVLKKLMHGVR